MLYYAFSYLQGIGTDQYVHESLFHLDGYRKLPQAFLYTQLSACAFTHAHPPPHTHTTKQTIIHYRYP